MPPSSRPSTPRPRPAAPARPLPRKGPAVPPPPFESALTAAEVLRRGRAAMLERTAFGLVVGLGVATTGFAAYTVVGGPPAMSVAPIVPATGGVMAWKRGVTPEGPAPQPDLDPLITGSLPDAAATAAGSPGPAKPEPAGRGYSVKGVLGGVALLDGPGGLRQVVPGTDLPGAGRVLSILPSGSGWIIVTSETIIAARGPVETR
ncbi:hypothetical protein [Methylobacterium sp. ID0610]|uniref:hypothetical protein n=1 Tax=Methylobacterium carpenticola TaxID=3344827 RepID=UPI00368F0A36